MTTPTIYTFTAAELAKRDVEMKREGYVRGRIGPPRGQVSEWFIEMEKRGAAEIFPYTQPTRSLREESESMLSSWRFRFRNDHIEGCTSSIEWRVASRFDVWGARVTLWHDLMTRPWQCDGCGAPLASETEEHQCP